MGRMFEVRKASKFARWDRMAKQFTRIGKEITIAVKQGGGIGDVNDNPLLRRVVQNARGINMPKDKIDAAIKRAVEGKDSSNYEEVIYEGYGSHGVAIIVDTSTDNTTRTVANLRSYFSRNGGALGTSGSVQFQFKQMGVFKLDPTGLNEEELELELIDAGLEEIGESETEEGKKVLELRTAFADFGNMQSALEERKIVPISSEVEWIPSVTVPVTDEQAEEISKLIDIIEQDDDVNKVFHNMG